MDVGKQLKQAREEKKISIRQLAQFTGISPAYISQIENNSRTNPKLYVLQSLCGGLGIDYDDFLINSGQMSPGDVEARKIYYKEHLAPNEQEQPEHILETYDSISSGERDLFSLLTDGNEIYYKKKRLNAEEKEKVSIILQTLLE